MFFKRKHGGELCRVRCIIGIVRDENLGKARERKNALDLIVAMANFHRTGERWFGLGIRARDLTLIPSWENGGMISGVAWRGARFRPCGTGGATGRSREPVQPERYPLPSLRGFSSPASHRPLSLALLPRWTWAGCRMCVYPAAAPRLHWAGRVRRAQQNDADVVLRLRAYGPFEAHWL